MLRRGINSAIEFLRTKFGDCLGVTAAGAILIAGAGGTPELSIFGYSLFASGSAAVGVVIVSGGRRNVGQS